MSALMSPLCSRSSSPPPRRRSFRLANRATIAEYRMAVDCRHFPASKYVDRVGAQRSREQQLAYGIGSRLMGAALTGDRSEIGTALRRIADGRSWQRRGTINVGLLFFGLALPGTKAIESDGGGCSGLRRCPASRRQQISHRPLQLGLASYRSDFLPHSPNPISHYVAAGKLPLASAAKL